MNQFARKQNNAVVRKGAVRKECPDSPSMLGKYANRAKSEQ
jgi:hypothetical protein